MEVLYLILAINKTLFCGIYNRRKNDRLYWMESFKCNDNFTRISV